MAQESAPAYQWFVKDWRSSAATMRMSFSERGVYRDMLDQQWEDGSLPDDAQAVADLIATSALQVAEVVAAWVVVRRKFVTLDGGRIQNARLERCRREYRALIRERKKAGKARAAQGSRDAAGRLVSTSSTTPAAHQHDSSSRPARIQPATASASSSATASAGGNGADARSSRLIFDGQRLTVFEWQLTDCLNILDKDAETFDLHEWFFELDRRAVADGLVIPKRDGGAWLQAQLVAEAQRRGLALRMATTDAQPQAGKLTTRLASALKNIAAEGTH